MVTAGRSCLQFWHMRYNFYVVTFVTCAVGVLLGLLFNALPRQIAPYVAAMLLAGSVVVAYQNVQLVTSLDWMVKRAPGFMNRAQHGTPLVGLADLAEPARQLLAGVSPGQDVGAVGGSDRTRR
jgi:hypothetical protein